MTDQMYRYNSFITNNNMCILLTYEISIRTLKLRKLVQGSATMGPISCKIYEGVPLCCRLELTCVCQSWNVEGEECHFNAIHLGGRDNNMVMAVLACGVKTFLI